MRKRKTIQKVKEVANNNWKRKTITYLGNFVAGIKPLREITGKGLEATLGSTAGYHLGNPVGAIIYGGLDLVKKNSPSMKGNKYVRLTEAVGTTYYGVSTVGNLVGILNGDFGQLIDLPFNASMLYETAKNMQNDYKRTNATIKEDLKGVKEDLENITDSVNGFWNKKNNSLKNNQKGMKIGINKKEAAMLYINLSDWKKFSKQEKIQYLNDKKDFLIKFASNTKDSEWANECQRDLEIINNIYNKVMIHETN